MECWPHQQPNRLLAPVLQYLVAVKISFNWLKEFVDINGSPQEIAVRLTMAGIEVESVVPLESAATAEDWILEVAVPPNRGDCLSVMGLAREVAAITGAEPRTQHKKVRAPKAGVPGLEIKIEDPSLCPRYSACLVRNVRVGPSPSWARLRLEACGIRAINNVVDVTNLVMLETGQPLHAFDWDKLVTKQIAVRAAENRQKFTTLDGLERELETGDLLICDGDKPVALAGVMGGSETEVNERARQVLLESAHFDPVAIRRTAKRLGLHSEASYRFERFVDPEGTLFALERAVALLAEVAEGKRDGNASDCWPQRRKPVAILLRDSRVRDVTGISIERNKIERLLAPLGLQIVSRTRNGIKFIAPNYRSDLTREADLIEEVVRLNGYGEIAANLPLIRHQAKRDRQLEWERKIRSLLGGKGLTQVVNLTFTSSDMNHRFSGLWDSSRLPVTVLNPLSQDHAEMRLSLVSNLVTNLRAHVEQKAPGLCVFEMGKVFARASAGNHGERLHLAGLCYGYKEQRGLRSAQQPWTFLDVKGVVEEVLESLGLDQDVTWLDNQASSFLHPGKAAFLSNSGSRIGILGEVHPDLSHQLQVPCFCVFELDLDAMVQYARPDFTVRPLPRFPSVERDVALVVRDTFRADEIVHWVRGNGHSLIEDVRIFDEYRGAQIGEGMKSLAYKISYRSDVRTLTDAEVNEIHQRLVERLAENFGARIRQ